MNSLLEPSTTLNSTHVLGASGMPAGCSILGSRSGTWRCSRGRYPGSGVWQGPHCAHPWHVLSNQHTKGCRPESGQVPLVWRALPSGRPADRGRGGEVWHCSTLRNFDLLSLMGVALGGTQGRRVGEDFLEEVAFHWDSGYLDKHI